MGKLDLVLSHGLTEAIEYNEASTRGSLVYGANEELLQLSLVQVRLWLVLDLLLGHGLRFRVMRRNLLCRHAGGFGAHGQSGGVGATGAVVARGVLVVLRLGADSDNRCCQGTEKFTARPIRWHEALSCYVSVCADEYMGDKASRVRTGSLGRVQTPMAVIRRSAATNRRRDGKKRSLGESSSRVESEVVERRPQREHRRSPGEFGG